MYFFSSTATFRVETQNAKETETELRALVKSLQVEVENKTHDLQVMQKSLERLRKEKQISMTYRLGDGKFLLVTDLGCVYMYICIQHVYVSTVLAMVFDIVSDKRGYQETIFLIPPHKTYVVGTH